VTGRCDMGPGIADIDGDPVVIYTGKERPERLQGTLSIGADAVVRKDEADRLEDAVYARTDMLRVAFRDRHVEQSCYLRGQ
jgi:hypothetical protein